MDPVSPYPALGILVLVLTCSHFIARSESATPVPDRFASIDGLRGFLAFFVFLYHSAIWYFYARTGQWGRPPSNLYTHFGHASIAMFFMITAFLFWSKLIDGREKHIDWTRLFISRVLRLAPLYGFVVVLLVIVVAGLSHFSFMGPPSKLLKELGCWASFTIFGAPDLNGIYKTGNIMAGVFWTLPYEWFFYLSLPLFALPFKSKPPSLFFVLLGFSGIAGAILFGVKLKIVYSFLGGIVAAFLVRSSIVRAIAVRKVFAGVAVACLVATVSYCRSAYEPTALVLLSVAFVIIACGNSLFGLLTSGASRTLGQMSYGIYLLHGMILFITFNMILDRKHAASLSAWEHWSIIAVCSLVLVCVSHGAFRLIEAPAISSTSTVTAWIHRRLGHSTK